MKIVQTPVRFYPYTGGVENYVYYLSKELVKRDHNVTVLCANEPCEPEEADIDGIHVRRLSYVGKVAGTNITPKLPYALLTADPDIIHTHLPTPWSADWTAVMAKIRRTAYIVTYHNDITGHGIVDWIAKAYNSTLLRYTLGNARKIIITQPNYIQTSPFLKKYSEKVEVIPCGVDTDLFRPIEGTKSTNTIFFLSVLDEFHRYKGLDYLLQAVNKVKSQIPDVKLIIGGQGKLQEYYRNITIRLGLEHNVEFHGFIRPDKIVEYYSNSNVFVLPSVSSTQEGFGMVLLEALACGIPVISTEIVGIAQDVVDSNSGIVVTPRNVDQLSSAIIQLLDNADLAKNMGASGRKLVSKKYTWRNVAEKVEELYEGIV